MIRQINRCSRQKPAETSSTTWVHYNSFNIISIFSAIRALATKLVEQWLKTVKGEQVIPVQLCDLPQIIKDAQPDAITFSKTECNVEHKGDSDAISNKAINDENVKVGKTDVEVEKKANEVKVQEVVDGEPETLPVLKISLKDGKQVISQVDDDNDSKASETQSDSEKSKEKSKSKSKDKTDERNNSSSSRSKHSSRSHSSSDKRNSSSSRHSSSSKDKSKDKDKDKHSSSHSSKSKSDSRRSSRDKSSSSKSKNEKSSKSSDKSKSKDKTEEEKNDKDNLSKTSEKVEEKIPSVHKLGKIPKLSDSKKEKPSISIEVRKPDEPKPKTVKTFNSKFRKHGLEEEVKPPPSRAAVLTKKSSTPVLPPIVSIPKRHSPVHSDPPPEKKIKIIEPIEKPGAIKLIPPKPKRKYFSMYSFVKHLLIVSFFPDVHWWWQVLPLMSPSVYYSLGCYIFSGKSKMHNLTGSKVFLLPVKYFFQINIEFNMNLSVNLKSVQRRYRVVNYQRAFTGLSGGHAAELLTSTGASKCGSSPIYEWTSISWVCGREVIKLLQKDTNKLSL